MLVCAKLKDCFDTWRNRDWGQMFRFGIAPLKIIIGRPAELCFLSLSSTRKRTSKNYRQGRRNLVNKLAEEGSLRYNRQGHRPHVSDQHRWLKSVRYILWLDLAECRCSCKVVYEKGLPNIIIYEEMRKYFTLYEEAVSHIWLCNWSILNFLIYEIYL